MEYRQVELVDDAPDLEGIARMAANPKVELCAFDGETWLRVSATAVEDDRVAARQDMLDHYPELQSMYAADDGNTQVLALTDATATFSSFAAAPRTVRW